MEIGDDEVEEATSLGDIPVLFGQEGNLFGGHLYSKSKSKITDSEFIYQARS